MLSKTTIEHKTCYKHPLGIIVKRGCTFFLYPSYQHARNDDIQEALNLYRMNNGEVVWNRCYNGSWLCYSKKLKNLEGVKV